MCWCDPNKRTPYCGKAGCIPPVVVEESAEIPKEDWDKLAEKPVDKNDMPESSCYTPPEATLPELIKTLSLYKRDLQNPAVWKGDSGLLGIIQKLERADLAAQNPANSTVLDKESLERVISLAKAYVSLADGLIGKDELRKIYSQNEQDCLNLRHAAGQTVPSAWDQLISDAIQEAEKAMRKFPQPNYVISKVAEEAGEVVKAAIHCAEGRETLENLRGEIKQTIAMIYRLWVEGDAVHGLDPVRPAPPKTQDKPHG